MKIKYAIHSSDSNPFYLDFWPIVSKVWKTKFNITPILVYIDDDYDKPISNKYGEIIRMKNMENIPNYLQNLWVRYWIPSQLDGVSIISDIDMLPISKEYFIDSIDKIDNNKYVHINPAVNQLPHPLSLASCYHVASNDMFKKVLKLEEKWEDSITNLYNSGLGEDHGGHLSGKNKWAADERYATLRINNYEVAEDIVLLRRDSFGYDRIDRSYWHYDEENVEKYIDSHMIRPYNDYKNEIDKLVNLIL